MDNELLAADEPSYMGQADAALADDGKLDLDEPSIHGMDTSWLNSAFSGFSVVIFGQQLTADKAKKLIYGLAAAVALLFIFWVADVGGGGSSGGAGGRGGGAGSGIAVVIEARFQLKAGSSHSLTGISFQRDFGKSFDETLKADIVAAARSAQPPCSLATADVAVTDMTMVAGAPPSVTAEVTMGDIADAYRCAHVLVTQAANAHSVLDRGHAGSLIDPSVPVEWTIKEETPIVPGSCGPLSCAVPRDSTCQDKIGTRSSSLLGFLQWADFFRKMLLRRRALLRLPPGHPGPRWHVRGGRRGVHVVLRGREPKDVLGVSDGRERQRQRRLRSERPAGDGLLRRQDLSGGSQPVRGGGSSPLHTSGGARQRSAPERLQQLRGGSGVDLHAGGVPPGSCQDDW